MVAMGKLVKIILLSIPLYILYLVFAGVVTLTDIVLGYIAALITAAITSELLIKEKEKLTQLRRLAYLIKYFLLYITIIEYKAHSDVIKRIFHPKMPINPGIVRIPYHVKSDYAIVTIANSITNTPGTVTVDIDKEEKKLFVHWIDVKGVEEEFCYKTISKKFEKYAKKIFD